MDHSHHGHATLNARLGNAATIALAVALAFAFDSALFWGSLAIALAIAAVAAFPVNRWLIARGQGHAVVHRFHGPKTAAHCRH